MMGGMGLCHDSELKAPAVAVFYHPVASPSR
jgi:hypothetical protein